ncbi:hypothetical protein, partial [Campylobacter lari]
MNEIIEENKALKIACQFLEFELNKLYEEKNKIENFLSFKIAKAVVANLSFKKIHKIPYELYVLYKQHKQH